MHMGGDAGPQGISQRRKRQSSIPGLPLQHCAEYLESQYCCKMQRQGCVAPNSEGGSGTDGLIAREWRKANWDTPTAYHY
jgi:hypothetical protein